jgi:hypothetical protein
VDPSADSPLPGIEVPEITGSDAVSVNVDEVVAM